MKILILSQYWFPENGVPQRRWSWLAKILVDAGHEVRVVAPPAHYLRHPSLKQWIRETRELSGTLDLGPSGEWIRRSMYLPSGNSLTGRAINQASVAACMVLAVVRRRGSLREFNPDLVIGTVPALPTALVTEIVARMVKAPYIIDLRDAWPDLLSLSDQWNEAVGKQSLRERILSRGPKQLILHLVGKQLKHAYKHANGMIVTSELLGKHLETKASGACLPAERIVCVRNVFPVKSNIPDATESSSAEGELHVLYAGTMGRAQKLQNVLEAIEIADKNGLKVKAKFVGAGVAKDALIQFADDRGLPAEFFARVEAHELADFYDWADTALVHLADWEPLCRAVPSKTYELMQSGIHITAAVAGETASLVDEHYSGITVSPEDPAALAAAWEKLIRDKSLLKISSQGKKWVEHEREVTAPELLLRLVKDTVNEKASE